MKPLVAIVALGFVLGLRSTSVPPLGLDIYMPVPEENRLTLEKIEMGRRLFFDRRLSRDESVSCSTCHDPVRAFSDGRPVAVGVSGRPGRRNSPALVNRGYGQSFFWDARMESLEELVLEPIGDPNEMGFSAQEASRRVGLSAQAMSHALASYVRSILSGDSPLDRFANGDTTALSADEQRGLMVFRGKAHCTACHIGPNFTDEKLHNTGVAWAAPTDTRATGHYNDIGAGRGDFKTPTLREVGRTAPYMHDGSLATLDDVVDFYDRGGRPNPNLDGEIHPLNLSVDVKRALVSFLRSLSGVITPPVGER